MAESTDNVKRVRVKVWKLGWTEMEHRFTTVDAYPKDLLKVDDWFGPQIGELCFNHLGKMDVIKNIEWGDTHNGLFNPHKVCTFEINKETCAYSLTNRIEVKRGKVFVFNGKAFVHQEPLCGSYTDIIARKQPITKIL